MKTKISRIGKRTLSLVLTMIMVVSMMLVGMVAVNAATSVVLYFESNTSWNFKIKVSNGVTERTIQLEKMNGYTYNGNQVYRARGCTSDDKYLHFLYVNPSNSSDTNYTYNVINNNSFSNYNNKIVNNDGTSWTSYTTPAYYVTGSSDLTGANWSANNTNNKMTLNSDGTYSITYKNLAANTSKAYQFKITNGTWDASWGYSSDTNYFSYTASNGLTCGSYGNDGNIYANLSQQADLTITFNPVTTKISVKATATATEPTKYTVTKSVSNGSFTLSSTSAASGTTINITNITPTDSSAYEFESIKVLNSSGTDVSTTVNLKATTVGSAYSFTMPAYAVTVKVTFKAVQPTTYSVTVDENIENGTVTVDPTNAAEGDQITVTVSPEEGYTCSGVTYTYDGSGHIANGSGNTYTFNMPASDVTVSATFEKEVVSGEYTIALNTSTKGKIAYTNNTSTDIKTGTANANDEITVTVTPNRGYKFTGLTVNSLAVEATDNGEGTYTYTFTVSENVTIEASYESTVALYTLTGSVSNATVTFSTQTSASVKSSEAGQKITVTVTPKSGYKCSSISVLDSNGVEIAVENLGSTKCSFIMPECDVTVEAVIEEYTSDPNHTFTVYFKAPSAYAYTPKVFLDGASTPVAMTYHKTLGKTYSGALTMCWFTCQLTVDTSTTHTLTFKTERTKLNATITDNFINDTYYLAVDNLMNGTEVVDLSAMPEYVQNYYRSATHMVYPYTGVAEDTDKTLGFTNYNGERKRMGSVVIDGRETVSIKSATLMQQVAAKITTVSDTQADLLDVNLDGVVDVRDATLTQKYLVGM